VGHQLQQCKPFAIVAGKPVSAKDYLAVLSKFLYVYRLYETGPLVVTNYASDQAKIL
jgi:hypothetical protein